MVSTVCKTSICLFWIFIMNIQLWLLNLLFNYQNIFHDLFNKIYSNTTMYLFNLLLTFLKIRVYLSSIITFLKRKTTNKNKESFITTGDEMTMVSTYLLVSHSFIHAFSVGCNRKLFIISVGVFLKVYFCCSIDFIALWRNIEILF